MDASEENDEYEYEYEYSDDDDPGNDDHGYGIGGEVGGNNVGMNAYQNSAAVTTTTTTTMTTTTNDRIRKNPSWHVDEDNDKGYDDDYITGRTTTTTMTTVHVNSLRPVMTRKINDMAELLDVTPEAAHILLRHFKWSTVRATELYWDDTTKTQQAAGIVARCSSLSSRTDAKAVVVTPVTTTAAAAALATEEEEEEVECLICMDTVGPKHSLMMPCGHAFCRDCWGGYLNNAITAEGRDGCMNTTCPDASCTEKVSNVEVQQVMSDPELLDRYHRYQLDNFAEAVGRYCPGPGCDRICVTNNGTSSPSSSSSSSDATDFDYYLAPVGSCEPCDIEFCTECSAEPHAPATCSQLSKWISRDLVESQSAKWMRTNTKICPNCSTRIEKNGGCQYIKCRKCGHGFCWVCGGTHHVWDCNSYKEKDGDVDEKTRDQNALERYIFYQERYQGHCDGQKHAEKQLALNKTRQKQAELKDERKNRARSTLTPVLSNTDMLPDFLIEANEQAVVCRRVLKYTYVFAFWHFEDPKRRTMKDVFENHQAQLERLTESLSESIERDFDQIDRPDVVNRTRVIGKFIRNVLKSVEYDVIGR